MGVTTTKTNKPLNPRGNDQSPLAFNRAKLYSGKALDFDGVNDFISTGTQTAFDMKSIAFHFIGAIDSSANGFVMHPNDALYNNGVMIGHFTSTLTDECLSIGDGTNFTTTKETFDDGIYFAVFSWDATNSKYKIFVNGVELITENNGTDSSLISGITSPIFGKRAPLNDFYLDGSLSNVRLFDVALTAAQVADLYNNPEKVVPTGVDNTALKLWLPMMEGAGTTAYDGSGNGNHGTISGATYVNGVGAPVSQTAVMDWNKGQNYVEHSEDIDDAYYTKTNATITADDITAPDGQSTADKIKITSDSQSGVRLFKQFDAVQYTMSFYAKAGTQTDIKFYVIQQNVSAYTIDVDLVNGTLSNVPAGISDSSITDAGNGWWRITATRTFTAAASNHGYGAVVSNGNGTNFYLWGFQHKKAASIGPYIPTLATAQTSEVLLPQGLTTGRDITGVNLFENVRKQGALNLDGNSWAEVHDNASVDVQSFTLECWVRFDKKTGTYQNFFSKGDSGSDRSFEMYLNTTETEFATNVFGTTVSWNTTTINTNQWYHVVCSFVDSTNEFNTYVDGSLNKSTSVSETQNNTDAPIIIGAWISKASSFVNGEIAQPRIYNRALTAEEVQRSYDSGKNIYTNS